MMQNTSRGDPTSANFTEITIQDWERRKEFVNFTSRDIQLLTELRPIAETYVDEVIEELYKSFLKFPETKAFFPNEGTLKRVKNFQKDYFLGLTQGEYGESYLKNRLHIGRVHQKIGLSPQWYMGAYSIYKQLAFAKIMDAFDLKKAKNIFLALTKIMALDEELAVTTYIAASESIITRQSMEIIELSTPVMQIWEDIIALPLIGTLDSTRTQKVMDSLLNKIVEVKARIAIIDITGVPFVDTNVAQHLIKAATAARLMGAECIISGIRPQIAQTIVHLGLTLADIVTKASMVDALTVAFQRIGQSIGKLKEKA